ncbi:MAG: hypothetical protein R3E68_00610 [Burkholderiaceae bacterium]
MTAKPTEHSRACAWSSFDQEGHTIIDEELEGVWAGKTTARAALDSAVRREQPVAAPLRGRSSR